VGGWENANPLEIIQARIQEQAEAIQHLKECLMEALSLCAAVPGAPVRPEIVLDEEWSK
jgi:hypothetical protein